MENFINDWKTEFPQLELTLEDLKKPLSVMSALFQIFERLGMDKDAILAPPSEENLNIHCLYYRDLIPIVNTMRVIIHVISQYEAMNIGNFLQPIAQISYSMLVMMFNLMVFNEQRLRYIAPFEEELFQVADMVLALEQTKTKVYEKMNNQAQEKGKRTQRVGQISQEIRQLEEELQGEEIASEQEKQQLDSDTKGVNALDILFEQKRATEEGLLAEKERKRALRVYDAEDIQVQAMRSEQQVQEAEEKVSSLQSTISQKENSLQILQMIKPNLDTANSLLYDIWTPKDSELSTLDEESAEGELDVLRTELLELQAQSGELGARRNAAQRARGEARAARQRQLAGEESALREAEDNDKKGHEMDTKATQLIRQLKDKTTQCAQEKEHSLEHLSQLEDNYYNSLNDFQEAVIKLMTELKARMEKKQKATED